ncbi:hypothetical protein [Elioraea thermophila]|uniref:hypothetical protein n=1 Tax=Elioraea thermophila TaxID=2185104 RepID=UPI001E3A8462|nr:hypothetical protein [Elioraea thermophila]
MIASTALPKVIKRRSAQYRVLYVPRSAAADLSRRERVRRPIRSNLGLHRRLTPRQLCRMSGLARSLLYRLFEGQGGVASVIQREHLRAAHSALSDPHDDRNHPGHRRSLCLR